MSEDAQHGDDSQSREDLLTELGRIECRLYALQRRRKEIHEELDEEAAIR